MLSLFKVLPFLASVLAQDELLLVQLFFRHGSKIPDLYDPPMADIWEQYLPRDPGYLSPLGETEMRTLGDLMRTRYIENERLLPDQYDQSTLYARTSSFNTRPMRSVEAFVRTFYPGAPVPIYTVDPMKDDLLLHMPCASYMMEIKRKIETLDASWAVNYAELIGNLTTVTEWQNEVMIPDGIIWFPEDCTGECRPLDCPSQFLWWYAEELQCTIRHGYLDRIDPYIVEHAEEILSLHSLWEMELLGMNGPDDRRGPAYGNMLRNILQNIQMTLDGQSPNKMYIYALHSLPMSELRDALDLGGRVINLGDGLILELRRRPNGEVYIKAEVLYPSDTGTEYIAEAQPLRCPNFQDSCSLEDFMFYINRRAPVPGPDDGCCFKGHTFFDRGCGDYLNPATLNIPECKLFRDWCPQNACDENQVVDSATLLCVPVVF